MAAKGSDKTEQMNRKAESRKAVLWEIKVEATWDPCIQVQVVRGPSNHKVNLAQYMYPTFVRV